MFLFFLCILHLLWELSFIQHFLKRLGNFFKLETLQAGERKLEMICCGGNPGFKSGLF